MSDSPQAETSPSESRAPTPQAPQLTIVHLLLWTLCSAIYLALTRTQSSLHTDLTGRPVVLQDVASAMQAAVSGAIFAGAISLVHAHDRSAPPMLKYPGHWLLVVEAAFQLGYGAVMLAVILVEPTQTVETARAIFGCFGLVMLARAVAYTVALRRTSRLGWRFLFAALACATLLPSINYFHLLLMAVDARVFHFFANLTISMSDPNLYYLALAPCILVLAVNDLRLRRERDWLHWTGVATFIAGLGVVAVWAIGR